MRLSDLIVAELLKPSNTYSDRQALSQKVDGHNLFSVMFTENEKDEINRIFNVLHMPFHLN